MQSKPANKKAKLRFRALSSRQLDPGDLQRVRGGQLEPTSSTSLAPAEDGTTASSSGTGKTLAAEWLGSTLGRSTTP